MSASQTDTDTIAAIGTAPGRGGIGIVRLSGGDALNIALTITAEGSKEEKQLTPRQAHYRQFTDDIGTVIDSGITVYYPGPASFTGEDVIEFQGHGGPVILSMLLERCLQLGARGARPGEFSERAFLNDKIDLAQAEAIADLIDARSRGAARQATASLAGAFSKRVHELEASLLALRMYVEAAIDFPEEEINFLAEGKVSAQLSEIIDNLGRLKTSARQGRLMASGATIALAGKPNAGKSSLMNTLAKESVSIVTDLPGTTRDALHTDLLIEGLPVRLIDTAGLRDSTDPIEQEGIRRARDAIRNADLTLYIVDDAQENEALAGDIEHSGAQITVLNKIDLSGRTAGRVASEPATVALSTKTLEGLPSLLEAILEQCGVSATEDSPFSARERHIIILDQTADMLVDALDQFLTTGAGELLAEDLKRGHDCLGEITGKRSSDDILGAIFSSFCIGK